jgi:hypothetical protein
MPRPTALRHPVDRGQFGRSECGEIEDRLLPEPSAVGGLLMREDQEVPVAMLDQ